MRYFYYHINTKKMKKLLTIIIIFSAIGCKKDCDDKETGLFQFINQKGYTIDIYFEGEKIVSGLKNDEGTDHLELPAGRLQFEIARQNGEVFDTYLYELGTCEDGGIVFEK